MQKAIAVCLAWMLALSLFGCGGDRKTGEAEAAPPETVIKADDGEYGVLQDLVDAYGFPFELRYTEGMELTNIQVCEESAEREWHTCDNYTTHSDLSWDLEGNALAITGDWTESFTLDMERGTATSLTDGVKYRFVVHLPDSIDTQWYVTWDTDVGFTEIDGIRQE